MFKVGDRVKIVKEEGCYCGVNLGDIGTVVSADDNESINLSFNNDIGFKKGGYIVRAYFLQLVDSPETFYIIFCEGYSSFKSLEEAKKEAEDCVKESGKKFYIMKPISYVTVKEAPVEWVEL